MTAGEHEMPPHLARYVASLSDPSKVTEPPAPAAAAGDGPRLTIAAGYDASQCLAPDIAQGRTADTAQVAVPDCAAGDVYAAPSRHEEADQETGHVDPAAYARWRQAQTELAGLIREANRAGLNQPGAGCEVLPASLGNWMATRAAELEQAEPEIELPG